MEDNNNDDTRQGLYDEFESEIVKARNPEAYFDEADLVEIFDYASDMDNYIVKMEVLLYGARHYPESQVLATRRAWFYSSLGEMDAAADVNSRVTDEGFLNKLLALFALADSPGSDEVRARLDKIVDETDEFFDEDLIQLVDYCADNSMLDWVETNRKKVEAKSSYPPTFIYEYADRAEEAGDLEKAQALFEELTMTEPFTVDFWVRLAKVQSAREADSDALASLDYALAVDPAYPDALRLKGKIMYRQGHDMAKISQVFKAVVDTPQALDVDRAIYASTLNELGRRDEAVAMLKDVLGRDPLSQSAIDVLMTIDFSLAVPYLRDIAAKVNLTSEQVATWVREHLSAGHINEAADLLGLFSQMFHSTARLGFLTQVYYIAGKHAGIVAAVREIFTDGIADIQTPEPAIVYPYLMSLARQGLTAEASREAKAHLSVIESGISEEIGRRGQYIFSDTMLPAQAACMHAGYRTQLRNIINALAASTPLPPDTYDPHFQ